jgi:prophage DNA circulation protein
VGGAAPCLPVIGVNGVVEGLNAAAAALNHAIDANDRETWRRAAHKLRGEAATRLGQRVAQVARHALVWRGRLALQPLEHTGKALKTWRARRPRQTKACRATCATR